MEVSHALEKLIANITGTVDEQLRLRNECFVYSSPRASISNYDFKRHPILRSIEEGEAAQLVRDFDTEHTEG